VGGAARGASPSHHGQPTSGGVFLGIKLARATATPAALLAGRGCGVAGCLSRGRAGEPCMLTICRAPGARRVWGLSLLVGVPTALGSSCACRCDAGGGEGVGCLGCRAGGGVVGRVPLPQQLFGCCLWVTASIGSHSAAPPRPCLLIGNDMQPRMHVRQPRRQGASHTAAALLPQHMHRELACAALGAWAWFERTGARNGTAQRDGDHKANSYSTLPAPRRSCLQRHGMAHGRAHDHPRSSFQCHAMGKPHCDCVGRLPFRFYCLPPHYGLHWWSH